MGDAFSLSLAWSLCEHLYSLPSFPISFFLSLTLTHTYIGMYRLFVIFGTLEYAQEYGDDEKEHAGADSSAKFRQLLICVRFFFF